MQTKHIFRIGRSQASAKSNEKNVMPTELTLEWKDYDSLGNRVLVVSPLAMNLLNRSKLGSKLSQNGNERHKLPHVRDIATSVCETGMFKYVIAKLVFNKKDLQFHNDFEVISSVRKHLYRDAEQLIKAPDSLECEALGFKNAR